MNLPLKPGRRDARTAAAAGMMEEGEAQAPAPAHSLLVGGTSGGGRLSDALRRMSRRNRAAVLQSIVSSLDSSDAHFLLELVKRKLSCDPLEELPPEVQLRILLHIADPQSLLRMSLVSRAWRARILGDALLWQRRLHMLQVGRPARALIGPGVADCMAALRAETLLARNWLRGTEEWRVTVAAHGASVVTCLQLDEPWGRLISGADNGTVAVWDVATGTCQQLLVGHQGGVWALKAAHYAADDEYLLVTGSTDRTLIVWDLRQGVRRHDLIGHSSTIRCVEIVGDLIVSGSRDGTLRVWDRRTGRCVHVLTGHTASVRCMAAFGERYVVSGSYDHTLRCWDVLRGECISVCEGHDGKVYAVAASAEHVFSGGVDTTIRVWDPLRGECVQVLGEHNSLVGLLSIHGSILVAGSTDGSISVWDVGPMAMGSGSRFRRIRHLEYAHGASVTALGANRYAIISGAEGSLRLWSLEELQAASDEPVESQLLSSKTEVVWRIVLGETMAAIAYQQAGVTRIDFINFSPTS